MTLTGPVQRDNLFTSSVVVSRPTDILAKNPALISLTYSHLKQFSNNITQLTLTAKHQRTAHQNYHSWQ